VKRIAGTIFVLIFTIALLPACKKSETVPPAPLPQSLEHKLPEHAQAKLPTMKLYVGAEIFDAELALTPEQGETGLMYRTNITDETAMLFVLPEPILPPNGFWMTNCPMSLSAAYINRSGIIEEIHHLEKNDPTPVVAEHNDINFVLEVNDGWFARHNINTGMVMRTERGSLAETFLH